MSQSMHFKARIRNMAAKDRVPAQAVLQNYMLERLLERVSCSRYQDRFILKGGMLIASLVGMNSRTTMDMDATLVNFPLTEAAIRSAFQEICAIPLGDEVNFTLENVAPIHEEGEYGGFRAALTSRFESIRTPLKVDVTTGDIITPGAVRYSYPSAFEEKQIGVWAYNLETILAEKVETVLRRSVLNTRMRDYYDVFILMKLHHAEIDLTVFRKALQATAQRRGQFTLIENPELIIQTIQDDRVTRDRWAQYARTYEYARNVSFDDVITSLMILLKI